MSHTAASRRFAIRLLGSAVIVLLLSCVLNTWINPLWVTPAPWTDDGFADYKPIHKHPRTGKAGLAIHKEWDAAIVGSSRLDIALDPRDPLWEGRKVVNLSLRGGNLCEFAPLVALAAKRNTLETVILGIDHYDLTSPVTIPDPGAFEQSPLAENSHGFEQKMRYFIGGSSTEMSIKALNYRAKGRLASYDRLGQWSHSLDGRPFRSIFLTDSLPQAVTWIDRSRESNEVVPEKIAALKAILQTCHRHDIALTILIPPNHAAYLMVFFEADAPDPTFDTNRRAVHRIVSDFRRDHPNMPEVAIWDFCDFHPLNCEALPPEGESRRMDHWIDGTHATPAVGTHMLRCALEGDPPVIDGAPYGTLVVPETRESKPAVIRAGYQRYLREHPDDVEWVRKQYHQQVGRR